MPTYYTQDWGDSRPPLSPKDKLLDEERDDVVSYRLKYWDEHVQVRFSRAVDAKARASNILEARAFRSARSLG
jgi:hypothetical protein